MQSTTVKWYKKSIIAFFLIIACLYMGSFLLVNDVLAQSYQSSSAWYGSDIGVETLQSFSYDSQYAPFSEIMDDASSIDANKTYVIETAYELYKFSDASRLNNTYLTLDYALGNDIDYFDALKIDLTYLFIAHDLAVVRHMSDTVGVMYLGQLVETAPNDVLFNYPAHPYTQALLNAVPVPDPQIERNKKIITGDIPSPINPPSGVTSESFMVFLDSKDGYVPGSNHIFDNSGNLGPCVANIADECVAVPVKETARVQEGHILIGHWLCETLDETD